MSTQTRVHFVIVRDPDTSHGIGAVYVDNANTLCKEDGMLFRQTEHARDAQISALSCYIRNYLRSIEPPDTHKEVHIHVKKSPNTRTSDYSRALASLKQELAGSGTTTITFHGLTVTPECYTAARDAFNTYCKFPTRHDALDDCMAMAMHCALTWK